MSAADYLLDILARSSLLLALVWLSAVVVGKAGGSAAMRHAIWLCGVGGLLLVPLLSALMPPLPVPILPDGLVAPAPASIGPAIPADEMATGVLVAADVAPAATIGLGDLMALLYLAVAAGLLGRLALGHWLLSRQWKRAQPVCDPAWAASLANSRAALGVRRAVALRIADGPAMPMTWGSLRPRILLPNEASGWTDERRRIVLLHELAHVARHDSLGQTAATIVCALYWFNPAVWYAVRQMRREQEQASDDLVLARGAKASVYARSLLDVAIAFQTPRIGPGVAMASPSELERRLTAIIRGGSRRRAGLRFMAGCAAAALVATSLVASIVPVPATPPAPPSMPDAPLAPSMPAAPAAPLAPTPRTSPPSAMRTLAPTPAAPRPPQLPVAPSPVGAPPATPAPPLPAPVAPVAPVAPPVAADDYDGALARYRREHDVYTAALNRYDRDLARYHRQVRALRDQGNLANSGNTGNSGNSGNTGMPPMPAHGAQTARPAVMPTPPTLPTPPTPPSPLRRSQGP